MSDKNELQQARAIINAVDKEMAVLFEKRMNAAKLVADYKKKNGLPVEDLDREKALMEKLLPEIKNEELKSYYIGFMNNTMDLSKAYQRRLLDGMKVAFSGVKGAFADIAVKRIFPYAERVSYKNFKAAYKAVENGECDCAVLPIENSYEGDVGQVMDLTYFGSLYINGIFDLPVEQNLFGTKDADIDDIKSVISHKQALGQCAEYINEHCFETIEEVNTAVAAKKVFENNDKTQGVICSIEAGEEYNLKLLDRKINKNSTNTTRFAVFSRVQRDVSPNSDTNFILLFTVKDEAGSLGKAISVFGESGYNLKTLKSRPSKDVIWNYYFFVEGEGKLTKEAEDELIKSLSSVCTNVRLVGKFTKEMRI